MGGGIDFPPLPEAPLSAGPPPLFDVANFENWMSEVFEDGSDAVLSKLDRVPSDDDMSKMRLLLKEEAAARRARMSGDAISKSYAPPDEGDGSGESMLIAFGGENDKLVRLPAQTDTLHTFLHA